MMMIDAAIRSAGAFHQIVRTRRGERRELKN